MPLPLAEYSSLNYKVSFFTGSSGHHAIELSRLMLCSTDFNLFTNNLFKLLEISKRDRFKQDEVLYGRAGYLASLSHVLYKYSLYKSKKLLKCLEVDSFDLYNVIKPYIKTQLFQLHKSGIENENSLFPIKENYKHEHHLLYYDWHNKCYLGAAHGIAGILQIMLGVNNLYYKYNNSNLFLEVEKEYTLTANSIFLSISATTAYVMSEYSFCSGNIMASLESKSDKLVHWCHGAPGWITLCLQLSKIETAKNMAKVIWERGLLRKGLGLCHGIPGNAYCFLQLYKHTNDDLWLKAAIYFAKFAIEKIPELKDVPDRPNSLYEGIAGLAYFLTELEDPMNSSYMPGLEVAGT